MDYRGKTPKKLGLDWTEDKNDIVALSAKNLKNGELINLDKSHYGNSALYNKWMKDGDISVGDILMTSEAPLGELFLVDKPIKAILSQRIFLLRPNNSIVLPWYLYFYMSSKNFQNRLNGHATGTTVIGIKQKELRNIEIELPSLSIQKSIVRKLVPISKKIEINKEINANLFKLAKIHFDRQLDSENIKFSQISTIQNGYAFKSKEYVDTNELMILRTKNINDNHLFSKNDVVYISKELFDEYKKFSFSAFDTVLVMVGASIGKTGFVTSNMTPSLQNQNMWRFRPKMSNIPGLLIFQYVNYINKHVIGSATGSARSFYRKKLFSEFEVPRINSTNYIYFDTLQREIDHLNTENEILYRIKHSLLNHYF
jgi:restriction endonuclease S subunit